MIVRALASSAARRVASGVLVVTAGALLELAERIDPRPGAIPPAHVARRWALHFRTPELRA